MTLIELVKRFQLEVTDQKREELADEIVDRILPRVFLFLKARPHVPEDLRTTVLVEIVNSLDSFEKETEGEFWSWCFTITRRKIAAHFKGKYLERFVPMPPEEVSRLLDAAQLDEDSDRRAREVLESVLSLSESDPDCHELLWERFFNGNTFEEIGAKKGITDVTARQRTKRCLDKLDGFFDGER
jgi:RNA polymerase sigma factor (sigma-70 family)